ncbi:MAG: DUF4129 domain-containing protein [Gemmatimonadaceae bacterium]
MHDTVQAVVRDPAFRRSLRRSFADRILLWLTEVLDRMGRALEHLPSTRSIGITLAALLVLFVIARFVIAARAGDETGVRAVRRRAGSSATDPWQAAETLLAQGRLEEAAHALYRGVILTLGREERLRLHPSKTSGDYARELRRRGSSSDAPFRSFTRRFDIAVYGFGGCDVAALDELRALSEPFRPKARAA